MTRTTRCLWLGVLLPAAGSLLAQTTDPRITSWLTAGASGYARVYETTADKTSGNAVTTWPRSGLTNGGGGQATPAYSDVQRVVYSANYVYVTTSGLPSYTMGNWLTPNGGVYTSWPTNRGAIHRIPRNPSIPTTKQKTNGSGGVLVNGVFVWANGDAQSYNTSTGVVSMAGGQGIWNRLAGVAEAFNFDPAYGHQPSNGAYHNHINPIGLRYQLGDNVTYSASTKTYSEAATATVHSPLIGWANDGLPIYGPYGYASALDATSGIRRMTTGFQKRDGTHGTTNLASTGRTTLPKWAAEVQGRSQTLASTEYGPAVNATYTVAPGVTGTYSLGIFAEDYEYLGDLGFTQGVDFDLNRQNVRYGVTPEFPAGTYAYFVAIDSSGATVFPDIINQEYFATAPAGQGTVTSISETVTEYLLAGPAAPITLTAAAAGGGVDLAWNSAEGATYKVESSADQSSWTTLSAAVTSDGLATTYTATTTAAYYRVTLTAIATYDTDGTSGTPVGKTATVAYATTSVTAPAITTAPVSTSVVAGGSVTLTVTATGSAPLSYQWYKDGALISGATSASYTLASVQVSHAGNYTCVVSNSAGSATSDAATLAVTAATVEPGITAQPASATVVAGTSVTFAITATGTGPLTYQWSKDGVAISGATSSSHTISVVQAADAGSYTCVVSNTAGSAISAAAVLSVTTTPATTSTARIVNLSARAQLGGGAGTPIPGFVLSGSGAKQVLVRAVGPTLTDYGVSAVLSDPKINLYTGQTVLTSNDTWSTADSAVFASVGAFELQNGSKDAALAISLAPGLYTAPISAPDDGSGVVLVEFYDAGSSTDTATLVNASTRAFVGTGENVLIAGFIISGEGTVRLLLRAAGPSLTAYGVTDALVDPQMTLYQGGTPIGSNDDWGTASDVAEISAATESTHAFAFGDGSTDAAMLVSLPAGAYTVHVNGRNATTGTALVELYVVSP